MSTGQKIGVPAAILLLAAARAALAPGGPGAHVVELGGYGTILSLLGIVWAAGGVVTGRETAARGNAPARAAVARWLILGAGLLAGFLLLAASTRLRSVQSFDSAFVRRAYECAGPRVTRLMRKVSDLGGGELVLLVAPLLVLVRRRDGPVGMGFLAAALFGTLGLQGIARPLVHRARPSLVHGHYYNSFPSGHTLAATVMVGALLTLWLPGCREWGRPGTRLRVWLWSAAVAWVALIATARVYLGCHYLTDVVGGILLGAAWVCFCRALLLRLIS